ncbi:MAG: hypothetical protein P8P98_05385, partial [Emcibacteraceae bacterium]|nr:hypothetical protein [Emcibacteraceae bacterium]
MENDKMFSIDNIMMRINELFILLKNWAEVNLFHYESLIQIGIVAALFLFCSLVCNRLKPLMHKVFENKSFYQKIEIFLKALYLPFLWLLTTFIAWQVSLSLGQPIILLRMASTLMGVWFVI